MPAVPLPFHRYRLHLPALGGTPALRFVALERHHRSATCHPFPACLPATCCEPLFCLRVLPACRLVHLPFWVPPPACLPGSRYWWSVHVFWVYLLVLPQISTCRLRWNSRSAVQEVLPLLPACLQCSAHLDCLLFHCLPACLPACRWVPAPPPPVRSGIRYLPCLHLPGWEHCLGSLDGCGAGATAWVVLWILGRPPDFTVLHFCHLHLRSCCSFPAFRYYEFCLGLVTVCWRFTVLHFSTVLGLY